MTPSSIVTAVRDRLGDAKKERWSDETLLLYVSLCQNDICMITHMYRLEDHITLEADKYIYDLPDDFMALSRLEYRDAIFPIETRANMDREDVTYPCAIKDNLIYNQLEIAIGDGYETLTAALINVFGVTVDADTLELDDVHGVVTGVDEITAEPAQPLDDILVYYIAVPPILKSEDLQTTLIVPDIWFQAFMHYVTGMALQDDNDANNIQRGEMENAKYARILVHLHATSMNDFTTNAGKRLATSFRRT